MLYIHTRKCNRINYAILGVILDLTKREEIHKCLLVYSQGPPLWRLMRRRNRKACRCGILNEVYLCMKDVCSIKQLSTVCLKINVVFLGAVVILG